METIDKLTLRELLGLTPDQHAQFESLPQDILDNLAKLPSKAQALIGERWRVKQAVGDTNFAVDVEERFQAWRDEADHEARWKEAIK